MPISDARGYKYRAYLRNMQTWWLGKPFESATRADLIRIWQGIDKMEAEPWTKHDYQLVVKCFYRCLRNEEFIRGFKVKAGEETAGPEDILTDEELFRIY